MNKTCSKCRKLKHHSEFYRDKRGSCGVRSYCKECDYKRLKERKQNNREKCREYERNLYALNKDKYRESQEKHRNKYLDRYKSRYIVHNAIRDGRLEPQLCFMCGKKAEAHHSCYEMPLVVTWLCKRHHTEVHSSKRG